MSQKNDFRKLPCEVVAVAVTGQGREKELLATAGALLANVTGLTWHLTFQYVPDQALVDLLTCLAATTGNRMVLSINKVPRSLAQSLAQTIQELPVHAYIWKFDDDHVYPGESIRQLLATMHTGKVGHEYGVITSAAVDMINVHQFEDWSNEVHQVCVLLSFLGTYGVCSAAHQKWNADDLLLRTDYISNGWIMHRKYFDLPTDDGRTVLQCMEHWPRGVRGYDCMVQYYLTKAGVPIHLVLGAWIEHTGMATQGWNSNPEEHSIYYKRQLENRLRVQPVVDASLVKRIGH